MKVKKTFATLLIFTIFTFFLALSNGLTDFDFLKYPFFDGPSTSYESSQTSSESLSESESSSSLTSTSTSTSNSSNTSNSTSGSSAPHTNDESSPSNNLSGGAESSLSGPEEGLSGSNSGDKSQVEGSKSPGNSQGSASESKPQTSGQGPSEGEISKPELDPDEIKNYSPSPDAVPGRLVAYGDTSKKQIALTFDDGGADMDKILRTLNSKGIKASFFIIESDLRKNPERWRQAIADGHLVLNHTLSHNVYLFRQDTSYIYKEIVSWEVTAKAVLGEGYFQKMKKDFPFFRTPGGGRSDRLHKIIGDLGYPVIAYWSCEDVYFSNHNPNNISFPDHYVSYAKNGAIFLMHPSMNVYLEEIIDRVEAKGFTFELLSDMIPIP